MNQHRLASWPLAYIEVTCLHHEYTYSKTRIRWNPVSVKEQLMKKPMLTFGKIRQVSLFPTASTIWRGRLNIVKKASEKKDEESEYTGILLRQSHPSADSLLLRCECTGYVVQSLQFGDKSSLSEPIYVHVTPTTMVHIINSSDVELYLRGHLPAQIDQYEAAILHNPSTVKDLEYHFRSMLERTTWIGTTQDALLNRRRNLQRSRALRSIGKNNPVAESFGTTVQGQTVLVYSSKHDDDKTKMVETILHQKLGIQRVHTIPPGPLIAKYGVYADVALSAQVHQAILAAAVQNQPVAIVLDSCESVLLSSNNIGDAAVPMLQGWNSYIDRLSNTLHRNHEVIFPYQQQAMFYNYSGIQGGYVLPVRCCLILVSTVPNEESLTKLLDQFSGIKAYKLPPLSGATRFNALQHAFSRAAVKLNTEMQQQLPLLSASAVNLQGQHFHQIAEYMKQGCKGEVATVTTFQEAMSVVCPCSTAGSKVQFVKRATNEGATLFGTVGGNVEAKAALEDALALDSRQELVGIYPPTGVLLYGPPGTGKTLLARAVVKSLHADPGTAGGAFVSLSSTDLSYAMVGEGEKAVAQAFETARLNSPAVIFIDEFQALFTKRSSTGSTRLTSTLMSCMDDLHRWRYLRRSDDKSKTDSDGCRIVVLAATNTPWMVDKSFLRPGRFDRAVHVGLPTLEEREAILSLHIGRMHCAQGSDTRAVYQKLAKYTAGFSGADISALCRTAAVKCLLEAVSAVNEGHFVSILDDGVKPSSNSTLVDRIANWNLQS